LQLSNFVQGEHRHRRDAPKVGPPHHVHKKAGGEASDDLGLGLMVFNPRVQSDGSPRPQSHVAVIYSNTRQLRAQLRAYVSDPLRKRAYTTVLSGDPGEDRELLPRGIDSLFDVLDARRLPQGRAALRASFKVTLKDQTRKFKSTGASDWTWIGTWVHLRYGEFDPVLEVERIINDEGRGIKFVCFYHNEGFCSLPLRQILETYKLHEDVIMPRSTSAVQAPR